MAYTILSLPGGGIRGLISLKALEMLAQHNDRILTHTNLLAGNSIGSTIIGGLTAQQSPQSLIDDLYLAAESLFRNAGQSPNAPAYSNSQLLEKLNQWHGDNTLSSLLPQQVLLIAFNLGSAPQEGGRATPWYPQLFTNVQNPLISTASTSIIDAVASSEAMPGMSPSYHGNVDGAFVSHDPTLAAIALAVSSGINIQDIVAICLGTGFIENWIGSDTTQWGVNQWLQGDGTNNYQLPPVLTNQELTKENSVCPVLNLCLNGSSTNLIPLLSQMLLPGRYVNLNPVLDQAIPETANSPKQLHELISKAEALRFSESWQLAIDLLDTYW